MVEGSESCGSTWVGRTEKYWTVSILGNHLPSEKFVIIVLYF